MGYGANVPGLLGLPSAYLGAQLSAWALSERSTIEPDCMHEVVKRLNAFDTVAITAWLAAQDVPSKNSTPRSTLVHVDLRCGSAPELHEVTK